MKRSRFCIEARQLAGHFAERFADLPVDCSDDVDPGVRDMVEWRDWSAFGTTPAQLRIERYLDQLDIRGRSILHIGVGNSEFARRFASRASRIVGTTITEAEATKANMLNMPNYRVVLHNKYSPHDPVEGRFDFIVDNNPAAFCCCLTHLACMLMSIARKLGDNGQFVTDRAGLAWTLETRGDDKRWSFSFDDLAYVAQPVGLKAFQSSEPEVILLAREMPRQSTMMSRSSYYARIAKRKLWRALTLRGKLLRQ